MRRAGPRPTPGVLVLLVPTSGQVMVQHLSFDWKQWLDRQGRLQSISVGLGRGRVLVYSAAAMEVNERATAMTTALGPTVQVKGAAVFRGVTVREMAEMQREAGKVG